jgi:hypothetical protein
MSVPLSRKLLPSDIVYRVIDPEHLDDRGPLAIAFEDPGKSYECQSFFVASGARPLDALNALARFPRAKKICGVTGRPATPREMYLNGYRVAAIRAELILDAIDGTRERPHPITINESSGDDYAPNGHIDLRNAKHYVASLARGSTILSKDETLQE